MSAVDVILRGQSVGAHGLAQHFLSPDRYLRLDPHVPANVLAMDRVDTPVLMGLARSASRHIVPEFERKLGGHTARRMDFNPISTSGVTT